MKAPLLWAPVAVILLVGAMLYFILRFVVSTAEVEHALKAALPGAELQAGAKTFDVELEILIEADGSISIDGDRFDSPNAAPLPELTEKLTEVRRQAIEKGQRIIAILSVDERTKYERILQVMEVLSVAEITQVTFSVGEEDEL